MTEAWDLATSDHPDPVIAAVALVHEQLNPVLLAKCYSQDQADQVLSRITGDLFAAANRARPHERGDVATRFAFRVIAGYRHGGHRTH
jgi:hypothetical protein